MKIVVLAGGKSDEHDVSMSSGSMIANALIANGHKVLLIDLSQGVSDVNNFDEAYINYYTSHYDATISSNFVKQEGNEIGENVLEICLTSDIVFLGLHGGIGENGQLAALFDIYGIQYTGSGYQASLLAMDKQLSKEIMRINGLPTANWTIVSEKSDLFSINLPAVVKPLDNGSSIGVVLVDTKDKLVQAIEETKDYTKSSKIMVEDKIEGREFSVGVLGNKGLPAIEIRPINGFYDYHNKYQKDMTEEIVPALISSELTSTLQRMAVELHNILGLDVYSRTDFIVTEDNEIYIIEINSLPGMTPQSLLPQEAKALGLSYEELCEKIIELSLCKYQIDG